MRSVERLAQAPPAAGLAALNGEILASAKGRGPAGRLIVPEGRLLVARTSVPGLHRVAMERMTRLELAT
jgi:hypothetical protein